MVLEAGRTVISNAHFDTTRAHVEITGAVALDFPCAEAADPQLVAPFKGNIDLDRLAEALDGPGSSRVACVLMTLTNNTGGGQPVSMANLQAASRMAREAGVPVVLDIARFAENAWFVQEREAGWSSRSIPEIVRETMDCGDVLLMSAKKDGLVNIGGFVAVRDAETHARIKERSIVFEGFPTYGGLAGRDIEALAVGLREVTDEQYLQYRIGQVAHLAVYIDAGSLLTHVPAEQFPAQALGCALYVEGGVRGVEIGSNMMGRDPQTGRNRHPEIELLRLAVPRRTYTHTQLETVADALQRIAMHPRAVKGLRMTYEAPVLRHFTARFEPVDVAARRPFEGRMGTTDESTILPDPPALA
jgi:tryptophanase